MKKIGILTLGCRVNQYESDALSEEFERNGYEVASFEEECDLYVINTCTVTGESDAKCRKAIRRARRHADENGGKLAVIGCFAQGSEKDETLLLADYVSGNRDKMALVAYAPRIFAGERFNNVSSLAGAEYEKMSMTKCAHAKAYVKIEDGCNNFCTYCFVPHVRGRVRSRDAFDIINEVSALVKNGYREVILTGIETASFGQDKGDSGALVTLIRDIYDKTGVERIRLGSMYPSFFTDENTRALAEIPCVMPHFHLSVQSASDNVLKNMKRGYGEKELYSCVENIYKYFKAPTLSCDMICGFPAESEEDFQKSVEFIKRAEILHAHIFPYSKRAKTLASKLECQVKDSDKKKRTAEMSKVAEHVHRAVLEKYIGKNERVLVEQIKNGVCFGYTTRFIYVSFPAKDGVGVKDVVDIKLERENLFF